MAESADAPEMDITVFQAHMAVLRQQWKLLREKTAKVDALIVIAGAFSPEEAAYCKTSALQLWLFGLQVTNILFVVVERGCHVVCGGKSARLIKTLSSDKETITIQSRRSAMKEGFTTVIQRIKESYSGRMVASLSREVQTGPFAQAWSEALSGATFEGSDSLSAFISTLLSRKDEAEHKTIRASSSIASAVVKLFFEGKLRAARKIGATPQAAALAKEGAQLFLNPARISKKLNPQSVDAAYAPALLTGAAPIEPFVLSREAPLEWTAVIVAVGARYKGYCSETGRTFLASPPPAVAANYSFLLRLHATVIEALQVKAKLQDVYAAGRKLVEKERPDLIPHLSDSFGFAIGLEYQDARFKIASDLVRPVQEGMTFAVRSGLRGLQEGGKGYSLLLADTVYVATKDKEVFTAKVASALDAVDLDKPATDKTAEAEEGGKKRPRDEDAPEEPASKKPRND